MKLHDRGTVSQQRHVLLRLQLSNITNGGTTGHLSSRLLKSICFPLSTFNILQLSVAKIDIHVLGIRDSEGFKIPPAKSASSPRASLHNSTKILLKNLPPLLRLRSALLQPLLFNPNFGQVPRILEFLPRQE